MKVVFSLLLVLSSAMAQEFRGTISGSITDASGSGIPGASVTVKEISTGTAIRAKSDSAGRYNAPFLLPGDYDIDVTMTGFKEFIRKGVHVGASETQNVDVPLEVGNTTQTMEVTADASLINTENASVGQSITTHEVEDLPLNGRTPLVLASLSMGVIATGQPSLIHPFDSGAAAGWSIAGSPSQTNEILIDGSPDATWDGRLAYSPPTDAVQEVRIKAFDTDAAFGHTSGGTLNQILKTGTNTIHGSAWEFNQPNNLAANNYFNNKAGLGNPVTHYNQYGVTAGGPILLPKLYDGRNKLFWFFAWEGLKDSQPNTTFLSVPTDKERQGDFSDLLKIGAQYQLYNPYTATLSGTTVTRQPYAGNIIPSSQFSPIAQAYLKYIPLPNIPGSASGLNNYGSTSPTVDNYNNELGRLDYNLSDRDRMFFDIRRTDYAQVKNNYFGNLATGSILTRANWGASFDNVFVVNSSNVIDMRVNLTRMDEAHPSHSQGFDASSLGFPGYIAGSSSYPQLPAIAFASNTTFTTLGTTGANKLPSQSVQLYGSWVSVKGNHTLKVGGDVRQYVLNVTNYGNSSGNLSFSANSYVRAGSGASSTVVQGQDFAEFLLGLPTSGTYDVNASGSFFEHYLAGFVQDDWRVRRNLTINAGLRFDYDAPYHEKHGRTVNGFDSTSASPLAEAAMAAYTAKPSALLPASAFNVRGGLTYPTDGAVYNQTSHLFSPRVGFAWSPDRFHGKTAIRGGFAMFVQPISITQLSINGAYSTNPILNQEGFSQSTAVTASNDNFVTPAATLSNPFPTGIKQPAGSSAGLGTFVGQAATFINPNVKDPYSLRWNFGFQHSLTPNTILEVVYMGNHGVHLPVYLTQLDSLPRQYLSTMNVRDQTLITALTATTANPFRGLAGAQTTASTVAVSQLLTPYLQFTAVSVNNLNVGSSYFQSLNVRVQKRFSGGVTLIGNYIRSKLIERSTWLNDTDPQPEKRISPFDHPNRFVAGLTYELPFGRSGSQWQRQLIGGWGVNSIYTYQTGAPITFVNGSTTSPGDYVYLGDKIVLNNRETNTAAFNTSAFDVKSADQFQFHVRTFSTTFPDLRQDGINEWSPSVTKKFRFTEKAGLQLRCEAYNILNHPTFAAPNTTATNAAFGTITAQANRPRILQLGARFSF